MNSGHNTRLITIFIARVGQLEEPGVSLVDRDLEELLLVTPDLDLERGLALVCLTAQWTDVGSVGVVS